MAVTANGWPLKDTGLSDFVAPNGHVTSVANRSLAIVFAYAVYRWDTEIEPVTACYGNRTIAEQKAVNPSAMDSNHISATAIDVNGAKHPYELTTRPWFTGFSAAQLAKMREILADTGILQNGLDFASPYRDPMHVQLKESSTSRYSRVVSAAEADAAAKRIGDWVAAVQTACGLEPDRIMGPGTKKGIKAFQTAHGLTPDGIWGPKSQAAADAGNPTPTPTPIEPSGKAAILKDNGIVANQQSLVDAAAKVGLPLSIAAAFVEQESHGRNVYGSDRGGALAGAGQVTEANYQTFLSLVRSGHTSNGVGPLQITYPGYFKSVTTEVANLWKPPNNLLFGLRIIKNSLGTNYSDSSLNAAAQRYNSGSPTGAPDYGESVVDKAHRWQSLLGEKKSPITPPKKITSTGHVDTGQDLNAWLSKDDVGTTQAIVGVKPDKIAGPDTVKAMQKFAGITPDAWLDPKGSLTIKMYQARIVQQSVDSTLVIDGVLGKGTAAAWHDYLVRGGRFVNLHTQTLNPVRRTSFPLPKGHAYAMNNGKAQTHSGVSKADRPSITRIQKKIGVKADGIYGALTKAGVMKWQKANKLKADGEVGPSTWSDMKL